MDFFDVVSYRKIYPIDDFEQGHIHIHIHKMQNEIKMVNKHKIGSINWLRVELDKEHIAYKGLKGINSLRELYITSFNRPIPGSHDWTSVNWCKTQLSELGVEYYSTKSSNTVMYPYIGPRNSGNYKHLATDLYKHSLALKGDIEEYFLCVQSIRCYNRYDIDTIAKLSNLTDGKGQTVVTHLVKHYKYYCGRVKAYERRIDSFQGPNWREYDADLEAEISKNPRFMTISKDLIWFDKRWKMLDRIAKVRADLRRLMKHPDSHITDNDSILIDELCIEKNKSKN